MALDVVMRLTFIDRCNPHMMAKRALAKNLPPTSNTEVERLHSPDLLAENWPSEFYSMSSPLRLSEITA